MLAEIANEYMEDASWKTVISRIRIRIISRTRTKIRTTSRIRCKQKAVPQGTAFNYYFTLPSGLNSGSFSR